MEGSGLCSKKLLFIPPIWSSRVLEILYFYTHCCNKYPRLEDSIDSHIRKHIKDTFDNKRKNLVNGF